ncbi:F0F1 ATP synthase subunit I [Budviciaceae bacterium CWB-B4]|uniref:F0F1 ATP synthase subunit I n=1 Tax=Limnobaculum xujianqingii TaxID=2738837 RepID=A0A9D7AKQ4_9GAMM|nr:F0F1 ATP synthase subunit I [Limnobaculum xujianqingii]MBK5074667.1 F0F1 ATP synthase subunit I [Limnobaculum xujianqingii]MBK5178001.1 F0F1 ATP synthase subunit I [Limnobaculum xujianqingii]
MSVALYDSVTARRLLLAQFAIVIILSVVFCLSSQKWAISAFLGGLSGCLPNAVFLLLTWRHQDSEQAQGKLAWSFFIGEIVKIILTIALLVIALVVFKAEFLPLCVTYLAVLIVQVVAPAIINIFRN